MQKIINMRQFTILSAIVLNLLFSSCKSKTQENKKIVTNKSDQIEVIDFYGTHRCMTCKDIEANTKYTLETYFANEPRVTFKTVNVDKKANYNIVVAYEAAGTALFLNIIKNGKETHIDLTDFAFAKGEDQEVFSTELKNKIKTALKEL